MRVTANIATYPPRLNSLKQVVASLYDQVDEIRIYFNEMNMREVPDYFDALDKVVYIVDPKKNLTDNGKFYALDSKGFSKEPEYYFSCDDDIIYPPDYVEKTIKAIKEYGIIISHHGRKLLGMGRSYYTGHHAFRCLGKIDEDVRIDVAGTGVTAFDTRYFHPKGLADSEYKKMSDIIFSLEAAKQGKRIGVIKHDYGWLKHIEHDENIYATEGGNKVTTPIQNKLADEIYQLNHGTNIPA